MFPHRVPPHAYKHNLHIRCVITHLADHTLVHCDRLGNNEQLNVTQRDETQTFVLVGANIQTTRTVFKQSRYLPPSPLSSSRVLAVPRCVPGAAVEGG